MKYDIDLVLRTGPAIHYNREKNFIIIIHQCQMCHNS